MPDILHWSATLLALMGLILWFWSARIRVPQMAATAHAAGRRKRQLGRVAVIAAVISALLQAASASASPQENPEVWLEASAGPAVTELPA
jgi:hypothetical protein